MPRTMPILIVGALSLTVLSAVPAEAASNTVTIKPITTKTVPYKKSTTIKPRVITSGKVKVSSKSLTVKMGRKTVAKNKASVKLKAGKYKVIQTVKYRTFKTVPTNVLAFDIGEEIASELWAEPGAPVYFTTCRVTSVVDDYDYWISCTVMGATIASLSVHSSELGDGAVDVRVGDEMYPEILYVTQRIYRRVNVLKYGKAQTKTKSQSLTIKQGKKPRGCATKAAYNRVKYGDSKSTVTSKMGTPGKVFYEAGGVEGREYKTCNRSHYMSIAFEDGYAYDKTFADLG